MVTVIWAAMAGADITTDGAADAAIITAGPGTIIAATGEIDCAEATFGWLFAHSETLRDSSSTRWH